MTSVEIENRRIRKMETFLPFSKPTIDEAEIDEVVDCLRSGWITTGPRVARFESMLGEYLGAPSVLTASSATAGLFMYLKALDLKRGDEVITTPLTFAASVNTIVLAGGTPVFADIEKDTYNLDMGAVEAAITPRTRVIMPVHFAGLPVELDALYALARKRGIRVLEDAAHAIGARYKGKRIGSFGDAQVFSFHPNKNMTTGEGGAIALRDETMIRKLKRLRFHGIDREAWARFGKRGNQSYDIAEPGYKFNMMDIQAALGIHQLGRLDAFNARRKEIADRYRSELADVESLVLPARGTLEAGRAWHLFSPIVDESRVDRDTAMERLRALNVGTGLHYEAVHLYSYYRGRYGWKEGDFPNAEFVSKRIFSLPMYPNYSDEMQARVIDIIKKEFGDA